MTSESKSITIRVSSPLNDLQAWRRFVVGLKSKNRFTLDKQSAKFVDNLILYAKNHKTKKLLQNTPLYRARINDSNDSGTAFPLDGMRAPPAYFAGHGRLNPRGIPYLYLASDRITAVSEIRPWVGCDVTVAEFALANDCELVNFSGKHFVNIPEDQKNEGPEFTWRELITWMFGAPFDPRDDTAYVPTQFLAERIKGAGFAGIIYDSSLSMDGYNVTLFDVNVAKPIRREMAHVTSMKVDATFKEIVSPKVGKE